MTGYTRSTPAAAALIGLALLCAAGVAQNDRPVPVGTVELLVRTPEGKPLANAPVEISPDRDFHPFQAPEPVKTRTDAKGLARFSWPAGVSRARVVAKSVGYGATGTFELLEKGTVRPPLPPLVPYGIIEGVVPRDVLKPGTFVKLPDIYDRGVRRSGPRADCDDDGRFVLKDVPCGTYWLKPHAGRKDLGVEARVRVLPGERVKRVRFHKVQEEAPVEALPRVMQPAQEPKEEQTVWAAGTVRDRAGRAVQGADVYAVVSYHGGLRMYETIQSSRTDRAGRWEIKGRSGLAMFSGSVLAHKAGHPPAYVPGGGPGRYDLVLADPGGKLEVVVSADGKPLAGATVQLSWEQGPFLEHPHYVGAARGPERAAVEKILHPIQKADDKGVARFDHLTPGTYEILATDGDAKAVQALRAAFWADEKAGRHAVCRGVAVGAGRTRRFEVAVYPQPNTVRIQVLQPGGKPPGDRDLSVSWGRVNDTGWSTGLQPDKEGGAVQRLDGPGLWKLECKYRRSEVHSFPVRLAPYFEASGVVAVSPLLRDAPPAVLTAYFREPGSVRVQLQDRRGRPARGYVLLGRRWGDRPKFAASTDDRGEVWFRGVQEGKHPVRAYLRDVMPADLGGEGDPVPEDTELVGRAALFEQTVTTSDNKETRLVVRPRPVGYVRGVVKPPKGRRCADYFVRWEGRDQVPESDSRYDTKTGEFLIGPFAEGKVTVQVLRRRPSPDWPLRVAKAVEVRSDRVARLELNPPADPRVEGPPPGSPQAAREEPLHGRVYMPDGKTPAAGAGVAVFVPGDGSPVRQGTTDGRGRIHEFSRWYGGNRPGGERPGGPTEPVAVAWLPGNCGAAVVPLKALADRDFKVVLPASITLRGKVTVGGKGVRGRNNRFRVYAEHEGKGNLDETLGRAVSAEADGSFELAGLTPGTYRIQAAMDGIWLSGSTRRTVGPGGAEAKAVALDIGEPGPASVVRVVDRQGRPLHGVRASVVRPAGPLARRLWPAHFTSDGAGVINVPPLEAGKHTVRVRGAKEQIVLVPALSDARARPAVLRVVVDPAPAPSSGESPR